MILATFTRGPAMKRRWDYSHSSTIDILVPNTNAKVAMPDCSPSHPGTSHPNANAKICIVDCDTDVPDTLGPIVLKE